MEENPQFTKRVPVLTSNRAGATVQQWCYHVVLGVMEPTPGCGGSWFIETRMMTPFHEEVRAFCDGACGYDHRYHRHACFGCHELRFGDADENTGYCRTCRAVRDKFAAIIVARDRKRDTKAAFAVADEMMQTRKAKAPMPAAPVRRRRAKAPLAAFTP